MRDPAVLLWVADRRDHNGGGFFSRRRQQYHHGGGAQADQRRLGLEPDVDGGGDYARSLSRRSFVATVWADRRPLRAASSLAGRRRLGWPARFWRESQYGALAVLRDFRARASADRVPLVRYNRLYHRGQLVLSKTAARDGLGRPVDAAWIGSPLAGLSIFRSALRLA